MQVTTIGLDIAKRVFQAHGVDATGKAVLRRKLQRGEVLAFSGTCRRAWWGSRPAAQHIIGRARSGHSAMRCG
jgi:alkylated DNA repair dioxygenase AlkB